MHLVFGFYFLPEHHLAGSVLLIRRLVRVDQDLHDSFLRLNRGGWLLFISIFIRSRCLLREVLRTHFL